MKSISVQKNPSIQIMMLVAILSPANSTIHSHPKKPMVTKTAEGDGDGDIGEYVGEDDG